MKSCIERYVGKRYGLRVTVKEPREVVMEKESHHVRVHKWQIRVFTAPDRPDLPKQMIKVEVANVPAQTRAGQLLRRNYDFLPDGYQDMVILTQTREEIMADKLVALVDSAYLRHRDIWDLQWLKQQGVEFDAKLLQAKLTDYRIGDYPQKADHMIGRLSEIVHGEAFGNQMGRFIQKDVRERTLLKEKFLDALENEVATLLLKAKAFASELRR